MTRRERLAEATALGHQTVEAAITDRQGNLEWLGVDVTEDLQRLRFGAIGSSLYGGRLGVALFLAALAGRSEGHTAERIRITAIGACSNMLSTLRRGDAAGRSRWWRDQPLGLAGAGGVLLSLAHLRWLLPEMGDEITALIATLTSNFPSKRLEAERSYDVMMGVAGLVGPLVSFGTRKAGELASRVGDLLVNRQDFTGGWLVPTLSAVPLLGFAHGASGIAAALARLYSLTGSESYAEAVERAIGYERARYDPGQRNWPDYRGLESDSAPRFLTSWCHGAPGIALARLCLADGQLSSLVDTEELQLALHTTAADSRAGDSLCCGRFGRAAVLRLAAARLSQDRWLTAAETLEAQALVGKRRLGCYSFGDGLGLFNGAAGVGLAMLDGTMIPQSAILPTVLSAGLVEPVRNERRGTVGCDNGLQP